VKGLATPLLGLSAVVAFTMWPVLAYACPMCFDGGNSNQSAFLYGSLFLMIVPVTVIGGLMYWAYRRIRAAEARERPQPPSDAANEGRPPLRLIRR
jgi:hypothetical protein